MYILLFIFTFITSLFISPSPVLAAPAPSCFSKLAQFGAYSRCETPSGSSFSLFTYTCANGVNKSINSNKCFEYSDIYQQAVQSCQNTCSTPTPQPSITPSPSTTSIPVPTSTSTPRPSESASLFSCKVRVFKLNSTDVGTDPTSFATPDREVSPGSNSVSPGDRYSYLIEVMGNNFSATVATISASTENVHGVDEPIAIKSTTSFCKKESSVEKYLSCVYPRTEISSDKPLLTKMGMIVVIQKEVTDLYNTSINFHVNFLLSGSYRSVHCGVTMLAATPPTTPSPTCTPRPSCKPGLKCSLSSVFGGPSNCVPPTSTPTPVPTYTPTPTTPPSNCYYKKVACFRAPCNPVLVCPTPKPTPTPIICKTSCAITKAGTVRNLCISKCQARYTK